MKKSWILLLAVLIYGVYHADAQRFVKTHNRVTVVTNPKLGVNPFTRWGVFPAKDVSVRRIVLHLTLGTPDSLPTAHWDYCDHIWLRRQGGKNSDSLNLELARMLTPYGSMYTKGWQFDWSVDITDFAPWLRDSVEIEYLHSGYEPETVGWALTLTFEITEGPEILHPLGMERLWKGHYKYGDSTEKFSEKVLPLPVDIRPGCSIARVRIQHTGHGMDSPGNCSEFCPRLREIFLDDQRVDSRLMWKDCGDNPLYPQGGTWVYDRAAWCPGDLQDPDLLNLAVTPGLHHLSMKMPAYTAKENIQAVENINAFLFQYSAPLAKTDVRIEDVIVPTKKNQWGRLNPAGFGIKIRIRNLGSEPLRKLLIVHGSPGDRQLSYIWKGNLNFYETADIDLPGEIPSGKGGLTYQFELLKPNDKKDEWEKDNKFISLYNAPPILPLEMIVRFTTNRYAHENGVYLTNSRNDTLFRRHNLSLDSLTLYTDTLRLNPGYYSFQLTDTAGNGLEFWAEPDQGEGYLRLFDIKGNLIHLFNPDCGNGEVLHFQADPDFERDTINAPVAVSLYPRQTSDAIHLEIICPKPSAVSVLIKVDKILKEQHDYTVLQQGNFSYQLAWLPKGRTVVEVLVDGVSKFKGRVNVIK